MENLKEKELTREEKAKIAKNEYMRRWRLANREKSRENNKQAQIRFWNKKFYEMGLDCKE